MKRILTGIALAITAVGMTASAETISHDLACHDLKNFTLDEKGGSFEYHHAKVTAKEGTLKGKTEFTARICPGSFNNPKLFKEVPYFKKMPDGSRGPVVKGIAHREPSNVYASIELKAPKGLHVSKGHFLEYCLVGNASEPASDIMIYHDDFLAPRVPGHTPTHGMHCVKFDSLSIFNKIGNGLKSGAEAAAKGAAKAGGAVVSAAEKAEHATEDAGKTAGKGLEKAGKGAIHAMAGLLHPCNACKAALNVGISELTCGGLAKAAKEEAKCSAKVSEEEPELAEYSPAVCAALETSVKVFCRAVEHEADKALNHEKSKLVSKACHEVHLCH